MIYDKNGIKVDNTRYIVGGETFPLNSIASVAGWENKRGSKFLVAVGIVFILYAAYAFILYGFISDYDDTVKDFFHFILAIAMYPALVLGLIITLFNIPSVKYVVQISTSAGKVDSYASKDINEIDEIVDAINEGIIARG